MKRTELIGRLLKEGFSSKTLVNFNDKQLSDLHERIVTTTQAMATNPDIQKLANDPNKTVEVKETLKGNQKKIDKKIEEIKKIDETINQYKNPYLDKLMSLMK